MQQISTNNPRSISRPLIWLTLAVHLAFGTYLYVKTTASSPAPSAVQIEDARP